MIRLSRLNQDEIAINSDLIEWVEAKPDTTVRMVSGHSILVLEDVDEVIRRILEYRRSLLESCGLVSLFAAGGDVASRMVRAGAPAEISIEREGH